MPRHAACSRQRAAKRAGLAEGAVPRLGGRHRAGAVTRARQAAAKAARSATSRPLAAKSSANRRGNRRVVFRVPRHTTVCGSVAGDGQPPDRLPGDSQPRRELRGGQEVRGVLPGGSGWRGGGTSAAARARATVSSSSRRDLRGPGIPIVLGICRVSLHGRVPVAGPCPLGDLGGWSRGPYCARICAGLVLAAWYATIAQPLS